MERLEFGKRDSRWSVVAQAERKLTQVGKKSARVRRDRLKLNSGRLKKKRSGSRFGKNDSSGQCWFGKWLKIMEIGSSLVKETQDCL
ncbi:hypothetical protein N780_05275 [Pontibacillus chungwhensis BH030062]|uniref:Uncharacterized protein n=1 Tax=Pontibacillus chungwhensis BH030062 TaxID=1385513 RepID=A0A0A2UV96_9BACI|nr:hypothetical protein N780_05275 [Pontibacillus chungwhensis BH030062]